MFGLIRLLIRLGVYAAPQAMADRKDGAAPALAYTDAGGPSLQVEDEPTLARVFALIGAFCVVVGGVALYIGLFTSKQLPFPFTPWVMSLMLTFGSIALLFHAAYDRHVEYRRVYQFLGVFAIIVGAVFCFLPYAAGGHGQAGDLLGPGFLFLTAGLLFLLFTLRNETDAVARNWLQLLILAAGSVLSVIGLFGGNLSGAFLLPVGLVLALMGLVYLLAFVGSRGTSDDLGYRTGWVIGAVGAIVFFVAWWRSETRFPLVELVVLFAVLVEVALRGAPALGFIGTDARVAGMPFAHVRTWARVAMLVALIVAVWVVFGTSWLYSANQPVWSDYLIPHGVLLMGLGATFVLASFFICSDAPLAILTRREMAAFVYSPVAYFLLFAAAVAATVAYWLFSIPMLDPRFGVLFEPIIQDLFGGNNFLTIIFTLGVVPALTMRLFAEEKRSGTLEVLLTTPVSDFAVVLSKFLAALAMFLLAWIPFGVYLIALRIGAGKDFDYRPLLSLFIVMAVTGANFVGMGLFFSSITRNQIVSFILALGGMLLFLCIHFFYLLTKYNASESPWMPVLLHMSYFDVWNSSMRGELQPKFLVFPATMAVLWLWLTAKVLEIRKWS